MENAAAGTHSAVRVLAPCSVQCALHILQAPKVPKLTAAETGHFHSPDMMELADSLQFLFQAALSRPMEFFVALQALALRSHCLS